VFSPEGETSAPIAIECFIYADLWPTLECSRAGIVEELKNNPSLECEMAEVLNEDLFDIGSK